MTKKHPLEELYKKFVENVKKNPPLINAVKKRLTRHIHDIFSKFVQEQGGYCTKFKIPTSDIEKLNTKYFNISDKEISDAFTLAWKLPHNQHKMYSNKYYHNLLLLFIYGVRNNDEDLAKNALSLMLFRMWNGRLSGAIQYCDPDTMDYVVNYMGEARHLWKKYKTPLSLILDYFTPTLYKKYGPEVKTDLDKVKNLFNQAWGRLFQIFYQNFSPSLVNPGKSHARSGLAVLYYKAKEEGLKMSTANQSIPNADEKEPGFEERFTTSEVQNMVDNITNTVIMTTHPKIDPELVNLLKRDYKLNEWAVKKLIKETHSNEYSEQIHDILALIITHLHSSNKKLCDFKEFNNEIKRRIISSKHTSHNIQLKKAIDSILTDIFKKLNVDYSKYSNVRKNHIRAAIILIFAQYIREYLCND